MNDYVALNVKQAAKDLGKKVRYFIDLLFLFVACIVRRFQGFGKRQRVLITKIDSLGDFILFSKALAAYRELYRDAHIVLLVQETTRNLAELCPYVDEIWTLRMSETKRNVAERWKWFRRILGGRFDIAIDAIYSCNEPLSASLTAWSGAPLRAGFANQPGKIVYWRKPFINSLATAGTEYIFEMYRNMELVRFLGYSGEVAYNPDVWTCAQDEAPAIMVDKMLLGKSYAVVVPGAQDKIRIWGNIRFAKTIQRVHTSFPVIWLVCGSRQEQELCNDLQHNLEQLGVISYNLSGEFTVREFACVLRRALICLSNESMAVHLAAALNVPSACILGGGHFGRFYPYPESTNMVSVNCRLPCYHCDWKCSRTTVECIESVQVNSVADAMKKLLEANSTGIHGLRR